VTFGEDSGTERITGAGAGAGRTEQPAAPGNGATHADGATPAEAAVTADPSATAQVRSAAPADIATRPLIEHPDAYERLHGELRAALAEVDDA
jgi:hypothetical protein